jgi:hypothetical protein
MLTLLMGAAPPRPYAFSRVDEQLTISHLDRDTGDLTLDSERSDAPR